MKGEYLPLPSLIKAAKLHFLHSDLPTIRRASANTDPAYDRAQQIVKDSHTSGRRKLILLSGVPGSGKTLVGIRLSYESEFSKLATTRLVPRSNGNFQEITPPNASIFLSGNGPLVAVLKNALGRGSNQFIQDVRKYVTHHESGEKRIPLHHVIILMKRKEHGTKERLRDVTKALLSEVSLTCSLVWQTESPIGVQLWV